MVRQRVVGLDPSLVSFGVYVADYDDDKLSSEKLFVVETKPKDYEGDRFKRYVDILEAVGPFLPRTGGLVAIETYSLQSKGSAVSKMVELGYHFRQFMYLTRIPFVEVSPMTLKAYYTGMASADKERVKAAVLRRASPEVKVMVSKFNKKQRTDLTDACGLGMLAWATWSKAKEHHLTEKLRGHIMTGRNILE